MPAVMRERGARCFSSGADADSCGMDVGREAFDETGHLSFSQFDYLDRYCAGAGSALLTKPGCHIVSRRNATKIDCRPGGAVAQGRLALRRGAHCDTDEGLGAQTTFAMRMAGVDFRSGLARYVEQLRFLRQIHAHAAMLKLSIGDRVPCRGHDRDEVKCVGRSALQRQGRDDPRPDPGRCPMGITARRAANETRFQRCKAASSSGPAGHPSPATTHNATAAFEPAR
ncbi:TPA: hypothetical protein QDB13_005084 [Burkholderia vietnamiensis]|nr:hypothetical protein [Burkholderia vietnamiensis]